MRTGLVPECAGLSEPVNKVRLQRVYWHEYGNISSGHRILGDNTVFQNPVHIFLALGNREKVREQINELETPELLGYSGRQEQKTQKKELASMHVPRKVIKPTAK